MNNPRLRVADFPRPPAIERVTRRIRIMLCGEIIADTIAAWRILETTHPPTYYLPVAAFKPGALIRSGRRSFCEWKGSASYFSVLGGDRRETDAAWGYPDPSPACAPLRDHVAVTPGARMRAGSTTSA
jgi:uncharacterized protein (DUF427 family)